MPRAIHLTHYGDVSFTTVLIWCPDVELMYHVVLPHSGQALSRTIPSDSWLYSAYLHHFQETP